MIREEQAKLMRQMEMAVLFPERYRIEYPESQGADETCECCGQPLPECDE